MHARFCELLARCAAAVADAQCLPGGGMPGGRACRGAGAAAGRRACRTSRRLERDRETGHRGEESLQSGHESARQGEGARSGRRGHPNPDKKAKDMERVSDQYNVALDAFTEALSNKGDMVEAWDQVGYVHLRLGAYREADRRLQSHARAQARADGGDRAPRGGVSRGRSAGRGEDRLHGSIQSRAGSGRAADGRHAEVARRRVRRIRAACAPPTSRRSPSG